MDLEWPGRELSSNVGTLWSSIHSLNHQESSVCLFGCMPRPSKISCASSNPILRDSIILLYVDIESYCDKTSPSSTVCWCNLFQILICFLWYLLKWITRGFDYSSATLLRVTMAWSKSVKSYSLSTPTMPPTFLNKFSHKSNLVRCNAHGKLEYWSQNNLINKTKKWKEIFTSWYAFMLMKLMLTLVFSCSLTQHSHKVQKMTDSSRVHHFFTLWLCWVRENENTNVNINFISREAYQYVKFFFHFAILLMRLFHDQYSNLPCELHLTGLDVWEKLFRKFGDMVGV